ncbi:MAG: DNA polymerase III subunit beta [Candidatus Cryosericum sp.]
MKFTISQSAFSAAINRVARIANRKSTMPVLANVLLVASTDGVSFTTSDLRMYARASSPATVATPGTIAVSAADLAARVAQLTNDVSVVLDKSHLTLKAGTRKFKLQTIDAEHFPPFATIDAAESFVVESKRLTGLIRGALYASSTDEARAYLSLVQIESKGTGDLLSMATDGHRIAMRSLAVTTPAVSIPIPRNAALEVVRVLDSLAGSVSVMSDGKRLQLDGENITFTMQLSDAVLPDVAAVLSQAREGAAEVRIPRASLLSAIKAVSVASDIKSPAVSLAFSAGTLLVSTEDDAGKDEVPCEYVGDEFKFAVNPQYFIETLSACEDEEVSMRTSAQELMPVWLSGEGWEAVVMPLRS